LVVHLAKQHQSLVRAVCHTQIGLANLIAAGRIGLGEAAKRFNPAKGKFSTYAAPWIKKYLFKARSDATGAASFSTPTGRRITLEDAVSDKKARSALDIASERDLIEEFCRVMVDAGLDNREKEIISQRYGLDDGEEKTQKQIAKKLGLSRARVSQLDKIARGKIAKHVRKLTA
jgi:RNA polymerase sporulation-specific sigma factor